MNQHLSLKDADHQTIEKEEQMNRECDTTKTLQDEPQESNKTTQPIFLPSDIRPQTVWRDFMERKIIQDVQRCGWHILALHEEPFSPAFAYSIGFYQTFGQPEIIIIGLREQHLGPAINNIGELMKEGVKFEDGTESDQIFERCPCTFREVDRSHYGSYFGFGKWYYRTSNYPVLQCVYPDHEGRYPWQPGTSPEFRARQPVLSLPSTVMPGSVLSSLMEAMAMGGISNKEAWK